MRQETGGMRREEMTMVSLGRSLSRMCMHSHEGLLVVD